MNNMISLDAERMLKPYYDMIKETCGKSRQQVRGHIATHESVKDQVRCAIDIIQFALSLYKEQA